MSIERKPFRAYNEERSSDTFTVKLSSAERAMFEEFKKVLQQEKDSTALKQLAWIGAKVLLRPETAEILGVVLNNYRKNKRVGIVKYEVDLPKV